MTVVVLAQPPLLSSPAPKISMWHHLTYRWTGWDGSVWDLADGPVCLLAASGISGLDIPPVEDFVTDYALIDGQSWGGLRYTANDFLLAVLIESTQSSQAMLDLAHRFYRSILPKKPGTLTVGTPDGKTRTITLRRVADGQGNPWTEDPAQWGRYAVVLQMRADFPLWTGSEDVTGGWSAITPKGMFTNGVINITSNGDYRNATLTNDGDEPTPVTYTIKNQVGAGSSITVAGDKLGLPALTTGQSVEIVTDPRDPHATLTDTDGSTSDVTGQCIPWAMHVLPVGETVPVEIDVQSGSGWSIYASAPSRFLTGAF